VGGGAFYYRENRPPQHRKNGKPALGVLAKLNFFVSAGDMLCPRKKHSFRQGKIVERYYSFAKRQVKKNHENGAPTTYSLFQQACFFISHAVYGVVSIRKIAQRRFNVFASALAYDRRLKHNLKRTLKTPFNIRTLIPRAKARG
jgi:hypothetical protein